MQESFALWFRRSSAVMVMVMVMAVLAQGCGGSSGGKAQSVEQLSINQIGQIFRLYQKGKKPPPKQVEDLLPLEKGYPAAIRSMKTQEVVVFWGASLSDSSDAGSTILAYQKDVPNNGGEVLMQDGSARTMTAAEFRAARKAGH